MRFKRYTRRVAVWLHNRTVELDELLSELEAELENVEIGESLVVLVLVTTSYSLIYLFDKMASLAGFLSRLLEKPS